MDKGARTSEAPLFFQRVFHSPFGSPCGVITRIPNIFAVNTARAIVAFAWRH
jgi:hypothetical protein